MATALSLGCGSGSGGPGSPSTKEQTGSAKAAITSRGFTVNGCQAHGVFDITSPQAIDFVAMDGSDLTRAQMMLYTVDARNEQSQVHKTAQHASPSMQALLESATAPAAAPVRVLTLQSSAFQAGGSSTNGSTSSMHMSTSTSTAMTFQQTTKSSGSTNQAMAAHGAGASGVSNASSASSAAMLVFDDLSQLASNHMVLVVDATAKQILSTLHLFQGSNGVVTAVQSFPVTAAMCSGVSASVPAIAPVAIPQRMPWSPGGNGGD
ncbi:MAG TPA: hypothetical protein VF765_35620 [Polyangiaceae bacterium]